MFREIVKYPNPVLRRQCDPVETFDDELRRLASDMIETMYAAEGVGLAAPQVDVAVRLLVADISNRRPESPPLILVNPEIVSAEGTQVGEEGCLSIPGYSANVERPDSIRVEAYDLDGQEIALELEEYAARVVCHEIDHLNGVLYLDRISPIKREMIKRKIRKQIKNGDW